MQLILQCNEREFATGEISNAVGGFFIAHRQQSTLFVYCDADNYVDADLLGSGLHIHAAGLHRLAFQVQKAGG